MTAETDSGRVRVLWLIKGLGPGGAEQLLVSSARVADQTQFAYEIAYLRADKDQLVPRLASAGVPAHLLSQGGRGGLLWPLRLRRLMSGYRIVHAHSPLLAGAARVVARTIPPSDRPITVSTEHNVWGNFALPTRMLNALTVGLDARRWAVSEEVKRSMGRVLGRKARVLIHGMVLERTPADPGVRGRVRKELGLPEDAVVSITVANLRREKDYPNLLRAAKIALEAVPGLIMLAVGQGPLAEEIRQLHEELELGDRFRLLGYRDDVPDLLQAADLFTLSSEHEGLPVSIMEAMNAGLPVLATSVGGVSEAVANGITGLVVPPHDHRLLADALMALARDPDLRERLGAAGAETGKRFDIRTAVAEQQAAYAELTRSRQPFRS